MPQPLRQTEVIAPEYAGLDTWTPARILESLVAGQERAIAAVRKALPSLERAAGTVADRMEKGGKLYYAGAGSSIRIAVLDGAELPATFGIDENRIGFLIAGGNLAQFETHAGAEDSIMDGNAAAEKCGPDDILIALAASGSTPFTLAAAKTAKAGGCFVVSIVNGAGSQLGAVGDVEVVLETGPEVIAGSTRMAAGTAQKAALNLISTLAAIRLGCTFDGLMVSMQPQNLKLQERATQIIAQIADRSMTEASRALAETGSIKAAVLFCAGARSAAEAEQLLSGARGNLRLALRQLDVIRQ